MSEGKRRAREEKLAVVRAQQIKEARQRKIFFRICAGALAVLFGVIVWVIVQNGANLSRTVGEKMPPVGYNETAQVEITDASIVLGSKDVEPVITVFEDLMCVHCANFEADGGKALTEAVEKGKARVEYALVAILDDTSRDGRYSTRAANALVAAAVHAPEHWLEFHEELYEAQPSVASTLSDERIIEIARNVGINNETFEADVANIAYGKWVSDATDLARESGLQGTPTVFVEGEESNLRSYFDWADALGL